jgi:hypothetical protein
VLSPTTQNVILLLWYNGIIFQQNNACGVWSASGANWLPTSFPGGAVPPAAVGYACPGVGGVWTATVSGLPVLLFTSPSAIQTGLSPINFFYQTSSCPIFIPGYTGAIAITNSVAGASPLDVSGAGNQANGPTPSAFNGSLVPGASLSLTNGSDCSGNATTTNWTFDEVYYQPSSLAAISGSWANSDGSTLIIGTNGGISEFDVPDNSVPPGCSIGGQVSIINPYYNLYSFAITWSNCPAGPDEHGRNYSGLMTIDYSVSPNRLVGGGVRSDNVGGFNNFLLVATR